MLRLYRIFFISLVCLFMGYSLLVYSRGTEFPRMTPKALEGADLWQKNNCVACHQLYGLGGYQGPDLTNLISNPKKGPDYARAFLNSGIKSMPLFHFTDHEKDALIQFLTEVDQTGYYPAKGAVVEKSGWIQLPLKPHKEAK